MAVHEVLALEQEEVLRIWKAQVQGELAPPSMTTFELIDHIPRFLQEIVVALRRDVGLDALETEQVRSSAAGHGEQRLRLGFSLDAVVREYGALHDAILAVLHNAGGEPHLREMKVVSDSIFIGIAQAVSEYARQRDAELLRQANEHFAFIAHELRNPLSAATMALEVLRSRGVLPEEEQAVQALERGLKGTRELIDHSLNAARIASGIELRPQWIELGELLEDLRLWTHADAEFKGVELHWRVEAHERVQVDSRLVQSAVSNLLRNAVKYTAPGGCVELRAWLERGRFLVEVEDTCGGLPPGQVEQAFAPFVRLQEDGSGFGLGLAIAKQAVDAHGGSLRVQNLPGKGCVFALDLPVSIDPQG
jgi:signal transduction histidine kinase